MISCGTNIDRRCFIFIVTTEFWCSQCHEKYFQFHYGSKLRQTVRWKRRRPLIFVSTHTQFFKRSSISLLIKKKQQQQQSVNMWRFQMFSFIWSLFGFEMIWNKFQNRSFWIRIRKSCQYLYGISFIFVEICWRKIVAWNGSYASHKTHTKNILIILSNERQQNW